MWWYIVFNDSLRPWAFNIMITYILMLFVWKLVSITMFLYSTLTAYTVYIAQFVIKKDELLACVIHYIYVDRDEGRNQ